MSGFGFLINDFDQSYINDQYPNHDHYTNDYDQYNTKQYNTKESNNKHSKKYPKDILDIDMYRRKYETTLFGDLVNRHSDNKHMLKLEIKSQVLKELQQEEEIRLIQSRKTFINAGMDELTEMRDATLHALTHLNSRINALDRSGTAIAKFPSDILAFIFSKLDVQSKLQMCLVCQKWKNAVERYFSQIFPIETWSTEFVQTFPVFASSYDFSDIPFQMRGMLYQKNHANLLYGGLAFFQHQNLLAPLVKAAIVNACKDNKNVVFQRSTKNQKSIENVNEIVTIGNRNNKCSKDNSIRNIGIDIKNNGNNTNTNNANNTNNNNVNSANKMNINNMVEYTSSIYSFQYIYDHNEKYMKHVFFTLVCCDVPKTFQQFTLDITDIWTCGVTHLQFLFLNKHVVMARLEDYKLLCDQILDD